MTITLWLEQAMQDADRRGLPALRPLLEALARATSALRIADWNADATGQRESDVASGFPGLSAVEGSRTSERE
ncbi:MAG: hypothetical protein HYU37_21380 [Acidobacteria bacterium]|nr:hypothetical protein [Acidobacteriota bacterium]